MNLYCVHDGPFSRVTLKGMRGSDEITRENLWTEQFLIQKKTETETEGEILYICGDVLWGLRHDGV